MTALPRPLDPSARRDMLRSALSRLHAGAFAEAARLVEPLYHRAPHDPEVLLLLGLAVAGSGHPDLAADLLDEVSRNRPDAAHPGHDLVTLLVKGRRDDAILAYFEAATGLAPADRRLLSAHLAYATALAEAGRTREAIPLLRRLVARGAGAGALSNLAILLGIEGEFAESFACFEQARALAPDAIQTTINHGIALLKAGRLDEGWPAFNSRLDRPGRAVLPTASLLPPLAPGARLDGKTVLVTYDSGFGDTLQFARYLPMLAALGARVLLWVPPPLHRLLATVTGVVETFSKARDWPPFDWHSPIIRLAEVFRTGLDTVPADIPYIRADPSLAAAWALRLPPSEGRRRIGLVWAGSSRAHIPEPQVRAVDRRRSIDPARLKPLMDNAAIQWVSLQLGGTPPNAAIVDPMTGVRDFADTAAIIASLDGVVSVDTAVAHLAGAMGTPVFLLDRYDTCWRWLRGREDSPWYPTLRIFRQPSWGDWDQPIRALGAVLSRPAQTPPACQPTVDR